MKTPPPPVDLPKIIPEFAKLARTTVRLHPRRAETPRDASKIGGEILWPASEPWPTCEQHNSALVPILQIRADDVPELGFPRGKDLFQLLWCPNDHRPKYVPNPLVVWRASKKVTKPLEHIPSPTLCGDWSQYYCPQPCRLQPERVTEYPDAGEVYNNMPTLRELLECNEKLEKLCAANNASEPLDLYQDSLSTADGCKIGGYPHWIQDPDVPKCACGRKMDYLLTIASAEWDGANFVRWLPVEDRRAWGGPREKSEPVHCPTSLMFGDVGNLNYFICRKCKDWPIDFVFQCS